MSTADTNHVISISVTKFPQNLLIPNGDNSVSFQVTNQSSKEEHFKFVFEGENLEIEVTPIEFLDEILFKSGDNKNIDLKLTPTKNGFGKLTINAYWMKLVEYTINIQKIREKIPLSKIKQILKKKQHLQPVKRESFNPNDFISTSSNNDVKKIEKQINEATTSSSESQNAGQSTGVRNDEVDEKLKLLAKAYLSKGELYKALESSLQITNEEEKISFYYNLIRANATINLDNTLQAIKNLNDTNKKNLILKNIALDFVKIDPDQISKVISLIEEDSVKENAVFDIISMFHENNPNLALKFTDFIKDRSGKLKVLFNLIKILYESNKSELMLTIINQIIQIILSSNGNSLSDQNFRNPAYENFKEAVCLLTEIDSPQAADKVIRGLNSKELEQRITKDLYNEIYKLVEEKQTKVEPIGEFSQFFLLNTYSTQVTNEINKFSLIGGNVSSNLLLGNSNFNVAYISLFGFDFSIFPIIDRVYSEFNYNSKKSIAYYIFPSVKDHSQEELKIIQNTLKSFFQPERIKNKVTVFNVDFIPYLGKPSVILSSNTEDVEIIKSKIKKSLGDRVDVMTDDDLFMGGTTVESLNNIFYGSNFNIVNLILSYEFINDYEIFKTFTQSLM